MRSFIGAVGGNVDVDFMDENYNTAHSASYEGVSPARVLSGITNFYDEGIKPKGNVGYSVDRLNKRTVEKGFGGIWIADQQEFAKFASAVRTTPHEEDGEGIAFTDNYFYAYYRNIDGRPIPYASVYMNRYESQDVVNQVNEELKDARTGERIKKYIDTAVSRAWANKNKNNANNGDNSSSSNRRRNGGLGSGLLRKGRYYNNPHLYVKTQRTDIKDYDEIDSYSLSRNDIDYLDAVNRGDMVTAQKMVDEAAEKAGFTIRAYHGTPNKGYNADWVKSIEDIYSFVNPDKEGINSNAEYGTQEYREFWDFVTELQYGGYRSIKQQLPDNLQRRYERGQTPPFTTFDKARAGSSTGASDAIGGFFFTPNIDFAQSFRFVYESDGFTGKMKVVSVEGGNIYSVYIKPQKVLDLTNLPAAESKLEQVKAVSAGADFDVIMNKVKNGRNKGKVEIEIMVKNPNLIKSADPVTYDDKGNIIPLSERFNTKEDDIRYSVSREDSTLPVTPELEAEANEELELSEEQEPKR